MSRPVILYMGDDSIDGAASYLAGVMSHLGLPYEYLGSTDDATRAITSDSYGVYILSDYSASVLGSENGREISARVRKGAGLLMIGGWDSFCGTGGDYSGNPIAAALPVYVSEIDDRINTSHPCLVMKRSDHPICEGLALTPSPVVCGFNAVDTKPEAAQVLSVERYAAGAGVDGSPHAFRAIDSHPLLVCGAYGQGRTAAFTTDLAPHWVGGFVDWGSERVHISTETVDIEVGDLYVRFISNLLTWLTTLEPSSRH